MQDSSHVRNCKLYFSYELETVNCYSVLAFSTRTSEHNQIICVYCIVQEQAPLMAWHPWVNATTLAKCQFNGTYATFWERSGTPGWARLAFKFGNLKMAIAVIM